MKYLVTGGAGFIGSNLVKRLIKAGHQVTVYDNLSTGFIENLRALKGCDGFSFVLGEVLDGALLEKKLRGHDVVVHLAANADIRLGLQNTRRDLEQNTLGTHTVLEAMRKCGVRKIGFSSSSAVYGDASEIPTPENCSFPVQISLYGASKLACEGLISAYCHGFGLAAVIFRFVSVLGEGYAHGHVLDFMRQLKLNPKHLEILGNGRQKKSYLYVGDCIEGMLPALDRLEDGVSIYNLGTDEFCEVSQSAKWVCKALGVNPVFEFAGGERGWPGDSPMVYLDCALARGFGFAPKVPIREAVKKTVAHLEKHWKRFS